MISVYYPPAEVGVIRDVRDHQSTGQERTTGAAPMGRFFYAARGAAAHSIDMGRGYSSAHRLARNQFLSARRDTFHRPCRTGFSQAQQALGCALPPLCRPSFMFHYPAHHYPAHTTQRTLPSASVPPHPGQQPRRGSPASSLFARAVLGVVRRGPQAPGFQRGAPFGTDIGDAKRPQCLACLSPDERQMRY